MFQIQFPQFDFNIKIQDGVNYIFDLVRKKYIVLTPEEWVRQHLLHYFIYQLNYPKGLISVEREIKINGRKRRYDIVVFDMEQSPWLLVECKRPDVTINEDTLNQLIQYHNVMQCPYWLLSNGNSNYCAKLTKTFQLDWLLQLPAYNG